MARKLPWSTAQAQQTSKSQIKRETTTTKKEEDESHRIGGQAAQPSTPQKPGRHARSALLSSSSPIQPPSLSIPQVELMDLSPTASDTIYLMVEDEFESTARTFTAHLHVAEYERLKRKAREAPPRPLPDPSTLSPSTSRATRMNLERRHLLSRQGTAISGLGKRSRAAARMGSPSDEAEAEAEDKEEDGDIPDPWEGTSLGRLMGENNSTKKSLVGLERLNSGTRASKGFARCETEKQPRTKQKSIKDIFGEVARQAEDIGDMSDDDNDNDDDIEELPFMRSTQKKDKGKQVLRRAILESHDNDEDEERVQQPHHKSHSSNSRITNQHETNHEESSPLPSRFTPKSKPKSKPLKRSYIDDFDDGFDETQVTNQTKKCSTTRTGSVMPDTTIPTPRLVRQADAKRKDRKARLDEVPVFLV